MFVYTVGHFKQIQKTNGKKYDMRFNTMRPQLEKQHPT